MKPLLFGSRDARLFGIYQAPLAKSARDVGVLICNPFGQEAVFAHRALRQLALAAARARFHVLRFDYSGTGDSAGESEDGTLRAWCEDIATASEELRATAGVSKVVWVGLCLGGTLAALSATSDVDRVVAWDPIVRGASYLADLHRRHDDFMRYELRWWEPRARDWGEMDEALGFPITKTLKRELLDVDLAARGVFKAKRTSFIISEETDAYRELRRGLLTAEQKLPPRLTYTVVPSAPWNFEAALNSSYVPTAVIQAIIDTLTDGRP